MTRSRAIALAAVLTASAVLLAGPAAARVSSATPVDPAAIPLGDGHVSTSPKVGSVDSCQTSFGGGGSQAAGPWINSTAKTWSSKTKLHVQGSVSWPNASFSDTVSGSQRVLKTNDLPGTHTTGTFPIASTDPAYAYDRNPGHIAAQSITWTLPANPTAASKPSCVGLGPIGVLADGVLLYNALDAGGRDAAAHEVLDSCDGHPDPSSSYHHHTVPSCITSTVTGSSALVGYAADGFGIYVERDKQGNLVSNASLDACHGRTSTVTWNGKRKKLYHYDATLEYPYTVGCYHGTQAASTKQTGGGGGSGGGGGAAGGGPPGSGPPGGGPPGGM